MKEFQIETAQNVAIIQNAANIMDRMWAYLIDSFIIYFYLFATILLLVLLELDFRDSWAIYLLVSLPAFLYYVLLETFWNGQTVGKNLMKIRVVKLDGSKPTFANYLVRWLLRIIDVVLTSGGLAALVILLKGNGQRIGDIAAQTTVISEKRKVSIKDTIIRDIEPDYVPTYSQVTLFKDSEIQTIKNLFDEAKRNGNHNVILKLFIKVKDIMEIEPEEQPIAFLDTVIKDYNYYTQNM
ncbi:putative RDD family membrane protein YckC [Lacinutrix venerupis]|uniref:RDD family protein n=1 Tax=Lacinutrix venerupis TaxID=1486034 RepID=UPI000EB477E3|nr:RDD family protein [Lacinutrix venerupis]RLJ62426.1 putative RDD family membrane protein YckC [Lacinutrix venerupis]